MTAPVARAVLSRLTCLTRPSGGRPGDGDGRTLRGGPSLRLEPGGRLWLHITERLSVLVGVRGLLVGAVLLGCCAVTGVIALRVGSISYSPEQVLDALAGRGPRAAQVVVARWRLPRVLLALAVGGGLGVAGELFQVVTRNSLGSPDLIGFTAGAQTGILLSVLVLPAGFLSVSSAALAGGALVGVVIYVLSLRSGFTGLRLILVGVAINSMLGSLSRWLLARADSDSAYGALKTVTGTLADAVWSVTAPTTAAIVVVTGVAVAMSRQMRDLPLGQDLAGALGTRVRLIQALLVLIGTVLVALATMAAGPVGFIALISPHLARILTGDPMLAPLLISGGVGALLLLSADVVAQVLLGSLPVGVATGAMGGLYLMILLALEMRRRT